jgi:hypothetical protein
MTAHLMVARVSAVTALLLLLVACSDATGSSGAGLAVSPANLTYSGRSGDTFEPPQQTLTIRASGGSVYLEPVQTAGIAYVASEGQPSADVRTLSIRVPAPSVLSAGVHTGAVDITGCRDVLCTELLPGGPKRVTVSYTIDGIAASPNALSFRPSGSTLPPPQTVSLSDARSATYAWTATPVYSPAPSQFAQQWMSISPSSGTSLPATITVSVVAPQPAGGWEYFDRIELRAADGTVTRISAVYRP